MVSGDFAEMTPFFTPLRDLLHFTNLRHGTDSFTSPPKEGMLRIFCPKIGRLQPGTRGQRANHQATEAADTLIYENNNAERPKKLK
jgi:hypothetical protein